VGPSPGLPLIALVIKLATFDFRLHIFDFAPSFLYVELNYLNLMLIEPSLALDCFGFALRQLSVKLNDFGFKLIFLSFGLRSFAFRLNSFNCELRQSS
jgi:hypothetical protein